MILVLISLISVVLVVDFFLIVFWKVDLPKKKSINPAVSILIAARNEEVNIERCLRSILNQNYPPDKIEILIGDDDSDDDTYEMAKGILDFHSKSKVIKITSSLGHQKGKANVLAHLVQQSTSEYLLITDADIALSADWINNMVNALDENVGIVTGCTFCCENKMQGMDWLFALGMVKVLHDKGMPVTTMGNNMLITREAYDAIGGYESIPFSITEDLEIFKHINKIGYRTIQLYQPEVLGDSKPLKSFYQLLQQRKRWMIGALQLPIPIVALLFIQAAYFPLIIALLFFEYQIALSIIVSKVILQSLFLLKCSKSLNLRYSFFNYIKYEFYSWTVTLGTLIYYLLPFKVIWKGRKY